ncbi:PEP-CTERM sorting domain-containing protein [Aquabacterium sp.]|uniref:PEP-CTERM sorting domain-containing protein n=1 Tax=Aquabacterium sp. TaxID=1872578 RepID=UPI0024884923|nr:PEP-CTERM sorting domain-containing protein [Aquabacterium sp.]MDI1257892.1 hypothetical protein [Aquabacterium sp.]
MKLQTILAAAAMVLTGAANASLDQMNGGSTFGDSSLIFVNLDSTGARTQSLTVDLGFNLSYFTSGMNTGHWFGGADIVWDFNANTITHNGTMLTGITNDWAAQRSIFLANSDLAESKWAVLAGSQKGNAPGKFLATGSPTATQLVQHTATNTANMVQVNQPLLDTLVTGNKGTILSADNGAYASGAGEASYVGSAYSLTAINGWKNNIKWKTWGVSGEALGLTLLNANGTELGLDGQFMFDADAGTLIYGVLPEPEGYALALLGLAGVGFMARRRPS